MQTDSVQPPVAPKRWPRGQKFALSDAGVLAEAGHREAVSTARASGRSALDAALTAWSTPLGVARGDGVVLVELRAGKKGLNDLARTLEGTGLEPAELKASVDRLFVAGLVTVVPSASQVV
jgi:hypothetical protein